MASDHLRERLRDKRGPEYWRSFKDLAGDAGRAGFEEFPGGASVWPEGVSRREFLGVMGASLALAGLVGCGYQPPEDVVPYVVPPEEAVPGKPLYFATTLPLGGVGAGVLVESHLNRPTHVEARSAHPGGLDIFSQAAVLGLYDPDRSQTPLYRGQAVDWSAFSGFLDSRRAGGSAGGGAGIRILTGTVGSPSLAAGIRSFLAAHPGARWHQYEPVHGHNRIAGTRLATGEALEPRPDFSAADRILALDADFLASRPGNLDGILAFGDRRRVREDRPEMNRLYAVEPTWSLTGTMADHRLPLRAAEVEGFARALARRLGVEAAGTAWEPRGDDRKRWFEAVARDLEQHRGRSLVWAGEGQPPAVHALALAMNDALGNLGRTIRLHPPLAAEPVDPLGSLAALVGDMRAGRVDTLFVLGTNPVYTAPVDLEFARALAAVDLTVHHGLYADETAERCTWHLPEAHPLESWGDAPAPDGSVSLMQPLIAPLYGGRTALEVVAMLGGGPETAGRDLVRAYWRERLGLAGGAFEREWRRALVEGTVAATRPARGEAAPSPAVQAPPPSGASEGADSGGLEIVFAPDPMIYDGRFANNGWLQELAKPYTKLTWDNALYVAPGTAKRLGLKHEQVARVTVRGRSVEAPVWVLAGQAEDSVTLYLGYGRTRAGRVGDGRGVNAYLLRTRSAPWFDRGAQVEPTGRYYPLVSTQHHWVMEGRDIVLEHTLDEFKREPGFPEAATRGPSLLPRWDYPDNSWGMAIDLSVCIGCSACTLACQSENNIPVVGKKQVGMGREMQWIRVDTYYRGDPASPAVVHQPVPCMHCDKAPCELVCPVGATVHSSDGLNQMIYNRCVGTRYCSNNCPYKVRRFNFLAFSDQTTESLKAMRNPDVTVRDRGVMEKCSYCVQRIQAARITSEKEGRPIRAGEVITACQSACPTGAIQFGDMNNPDEEVNRWKEEPHGYHLLADVGTLPRTSYLGRIGNPNPELGERA